jgi:hypothetical protein
MRRAIRISRIKIKKRFDGVFEITVTFEFVPCTRTCVHFILKYQLVLSGVFVSVRLFKYTRTVQIIRILRLFTYTRTVQLIRILRVLGTNISDRCSNQLS